MRRCAPFCVLSAVTMVASLGLVAAPAQAFVTPAGSCSGALMLGAITPGLVDTTQSERIDMRLTEDVTNHARNGGTCSGFILYKHKVVNPPTAPEAVRIESIRLAGAASCSTTATAPGVDAGDPAAAAAYPLYGEMDLQTMRARSRLRAYIHLTGMTTYDVMGIAGTVSKGSSVGAAVSGGLWMDPAVKLLKTDTGWPGLSNSGFGIDPNALVTLFGCADGIPGTVPPPGITAVLIGDGVSPLLGSPAPGLQFDFGI